MAAEAGVRLTIQQLAADWREVRCEMPSSPRHPLLGAVHRGHPARVELALDPVALGDSGR